MTRVLVGLVFGFWLFLFGHVFFLPQQASALCFLYDHVSFGFEARANEGKKKEEKDKSLGIQIVKRRINNIGKGVWKVSWQYFKSTFGSSNDRPENFMNRVTCSQSVR